MPIKLVSLNEAKNEYTAYSVILKFNNGYAAYSIISELKNKNAAYSVILKLWIYAHRFIVKCNFILFYITKRLNVRKRAKIRSRYNQAPHPTQDTSG